LNESIANPRILTHLLSLTFISLFLFSDTEHDQPKAVFLVFEYLDYDLCGILETPEVRITEDHVKSWIHQLLKGTHYMHMNKILHRDLKSSNILINNKGQLKIADWGLARSWNKEMHNLTNRVITLWYRPPELLLGAQSYTPAIDMWSCGCICAEMFRRRPLLQGRDEATQLDLIFRTCGTPKVQEWSDINKMCPLWKNFESKEQAQHPRNIRNVMKTNVVNPNWVTENAKDLIDGLLTLNPKNRKTASNALVHEYFFDAPLAKTADQLTMNLGVDSVHELEARAGKQKKHAQAVASAAGSGGGGGGSSRTAPRAYPKANNGHGSK
jgi:cyclin-dependent kinase 12/13